MDMSERLQLWDIAKEALSGESSWGFLCGGVAVDAFFLG